MFSIAIASDSATDRQYKVGDTVLLHQKKTTTKPPYDPDPFTVTIIQGTQITATRRGKVVTRNVDKWKILKKRPYYLTDTDKHTKHDKRGQTNDDEEDDDDFDLPKPKPVPRPVTPPNQEVQAPPAGPPVPPPTPPPGPPGPLGGPRGTPGREKWLVANGPWRQKQTSPSPRERKKRKAAARRRDKEQQGNYWLRSRGTPEEGEEE